MEVPFTRKLRSDLHWTRYQAVERIGRAESDRSRQGMECRKSLLRRMGSCVDENSRLCVVFELWVPSCFCFCNVDLPRHTNLSSSQHFVTVSARFTGSSIKRHSIFAT
jgi:hypothetical protein